MILKVFSRHSTLADIPGGCARLVPRRLALFQRSSGGAEAFSYAEFDRASAGFAALARETWGGGRGTILLLAENRPLWAVAYFGLVRAGFIVVPLDPNLTPEETRHLAEHSGARGGVFSQRFTTVMPRLVPDPDEFRRLWLSLDDPGLVDRLLSAPPFRDEMSLQAGGVATLLYTSGTTGMPKGVPLTHENIIHNVLDLGGASSYRRSDRLLSVLPLNHVYEFTGGLVGALMCGATVYFADSLKPNRIVAAMKEYRVTHMNVVPLLLTLIQDGILEKIPAGSRSTFERLRTLTEWLTPWFGAGPGRVLFGSVHREFGGALRRFNCGGSFVNPALVRFFRGLGIQVSIGYGLSETSPVVTFSPNLRPGREDSVGRPLRSVKIRVDSPGPDQPGEILVRGKSVFQGYFQHPAATAEAFDGEWFRTGDVGTLRDGYLYLVGRQKNMIITASGKNVYLDDVQHLYGDLPGAREFTVVGVPNDSSDSSRGEGMLAVVIPDEEKLKIMNVSKSQWQAHFDGVFREKARAVVPMKRIQRVRLWGEPFPRTPSGKVKKFLLAKCIREELVAKDEKSSDHR